MRFLISWDSHENLTRFLLTHEIFSNYMDNCARKFTRINLMSFCNFLMRKCAKSHGKIYDILMRTSWKVSWEAHETTKISWGKRLKSHVKAKISWDSHEIWWKAHENLMRNFAFFSFLMRISWDSHENLQNLTRIFVRVKKDFQGTTPLGYFSHLWS